MQVHKSGAGDTVPEAKVQAVATYVSQAFPKMESDHIPEGSNYADLFRVIESGSKRLKYQLRIRRTFYDRYASASDIAVALAGVDEKMRAASPTPVDLN